ncbi:hypothetical protein HU200_026766 [Digitaria exilis]|uniref:Mitochondrial import inner membrane translocase subunit TIM50 n=1 Tax=Digitaria exilis TaxID=1010633 RepID=A0A835BY62_9POAL|nr:hypothetical protein HU200_026766 [Digitaria exilis]
MSRALLRHRRRLFPEARTAAAAAFPSSRAASFSSYSRGASSHASATAAAAAAAASESSAGAGEQSAPPPPPAARGRWGLLKFGALAAVAGAIGGVGYATYAYSLPEIDAKTREFRKNPAPPIPEDASAFEKYKAMAYSTAVEGMLFSHLYLLIFVLSSTVFVSVSVKAIELYLDVRSTIEDHVRGFTEPTSDKLLPDLLPQEEHVFTLVLDLNETLVYSDWQAICYACHIGMRKLTDGSLNGKVQIRERGWRTFKRPGVDAFLEHMSKFYEVVVYSDQPPMYVEPVFERLNSRGTIQHRLSRPATKYVDGKHYRDLSKLNRKPQQVIYLSAHALETCLQPENCVEIKPFKLENNDTQLLDLIPFLEYVAMARPTDIRTVLVSYQGHDVAAEFIERSKEHQRRKHEQSKHGRLWRR